MKSILPMRAQALGVLLLTQALLLPAVRFCAGGEEVSETNREPYTLFNPVPAAQMRAWHTDFAGVSPYTTDAGHFEATVFPVAYAYFHNDVGSGSFRANIWSYGNTVLKAGLLNPLDLEFGILPYEQVTSTFQGGSFIESRHTSSGLGDCFSRLKLNAWGNDGGPTALALSGFVKFPTAAAALGNGQYEGGPALHFAAWLPYGFELRLDSSVDLFEAQGRQASFANLVSLSHGLTGPLRSFVQYTTEVSTTSADWASELRTGLMYRLTPNLEAEAEVAFGLNGVFADYAPAIALAARF